MNATDEIMMLSEIEDTFDSEWVLLEDPILDAREQGTGGKVVYHSKHRDEVYRKAMELQLKHSAFLYTGPIPDNIFINF